MQLIFDNHLEIFYATIIGSSQMAIDPLHLLTRNKALHIMKESGGY